MTDIAQEVLNRADAITAWLSGKIGTAVDFATQQAIDIAMQYVAFGRIYYTSIILLTIVAFIGIWYIASRKSVREVTTNGSFVEAFLVSVPVLSIFCANFKDMVLTWAAPKVWLIIQLTELTKAVK